MPASAIDHVVFDIGKVLLHYDPELAYLALIPDAAERRHFLATICSPEWNLEQDRGRGWREAEAQLIARPPQQAVRSGHSAAAGRTWCRTPATTRWPYTKR